MAGILMFLLFQLVSRTYWDAPLWLEFTSVSYVLLGIAVFLGSMLWNLFRDPSVVVRLQSRVIVVGIALGLFIPISVLALRFWGIHLFPDPIIGYGVCAFIFPISIGYTIVKHDLFAIDVIVRRTYGYVLSTGAIVATYVLLLSGVNVLFGSGEISRSPLFSIGFALLAVFGFRPLHERLQALVDRAFYRQRYDYRKTIQSISEAMTSILDPMEIRKLLIGSVVREMVLENGLLLLREPSGDKYAVSVVEGGGGAETLPAGPLPAGEEIVKVLEGRNAPVFRYDVELNPRFEGHREALSRAFDAFRAESMMPLKYKDSMRGIVCLGRKKSGRLFTPEDVDLLKTITHQTAIALENAHLFEDNLEKGRMEEELKIAHDIQVSMLPERAPEIEGLRIAARSIPAREVGGDFYDFVTMDGEKGMGKVAVVVGDVSGKAVSGALVMAASRSVFRVLTEANASVGEVMNRMNYRLHRDVRKGMFVAALYALLDSREKTLTLSNAGQTSPVLCPADGGPPVLIETKGDRFPLGIIEECTYEETRVSLKGGDIVVLYTDGVVEAVNAVGEMYGFERFLETAGKGRGLSADGLLETLLEDVARFVGGVEPHDDITIVVAKIH
jgi:serine phosphatase RsbU (regulator of sigma subunit)